MNELLRSGFPTGRTKGLFWLPPVLHVYGRHSPSYRPAELTKATTRVRGVRRTDIRIVADLGLDNIAQGFEAGGVLCEGVVVPVRFLDRFREMLAVAHTTRADLIHVIL